MRINLGVLIVALVSVSLCAPTHGECIAGILQHRFRSAGDDGDELHALIRQIRMTKACEDPAERAEIALDEKLNDLVRFGAMKMLFERFLRETERLSPSAGGVKWADFFTKDRIYDHNDAKTTPVDAFRDLVPGATDERPSVAVFCIAAPGGAADQRGLVWIAVAPFISIDQLIKIASGESSEKASVVAVWGMEIGDE